MASRDPELWARAYQAKNKLMTQLLHHPEVTLIDIGYDPNQAETPPPLVLRVHVRRLVDPQTLRLHQEINGIPVQIVKGDYHPQ